MRQSLSKLLLGAKREMIGSAILSMVLFIFGSSVRPAAYHNYSNSIDFIWINSVGRSLQYGGRIP